MLIQKLTNFQCVFCNWKDLMSNQQTSRDPLQLKCFFRLTATHTLSGFRHLPEAGKFQGVGRLEGKVDLYYKVSNLITVCPVRITAS